MLFSSSWITYSTGEYKTAYANYGNPAPYFRKRFTLKNNLKSATLYASALGVFKIYVNGKEISNDYLAPGWVDYSKKLAFVKYDVTNFLTHDNAIGVITADGWAVGHVGSNYTFKRNNYNDRVEFFACIHVEYVDGTTEDIHTDSSWKATKGEIIRSDIYMGEYVDHRLSLGDFSLFEYDDSAWADVEVDTFKFSRNLYLEQAKNPPIIVKHTFTPVLLRKEDNKFIYDVTQNISGVLRCVFKGDRGAKIVIRHGELLSDGKLYTENLRKAEATDTYILSGEGQEVFRPLFTFHGFRYAELTITGNAQIIDVVAQAMYTDLRATGSFECSNNIVTKIYQNALWGQRDNFLDVPTDCPQRDERLGWTADAQIFCQSAMWNMDCRVFYDKYLCDIRDGQLGNGVIPVVAPLPHVGYRDYCGYDAAAGWAEAIGEIPYAHYKMYGDKKIIRDNLFALKRLIDYYEYESPDGIRSGPKKYGDWLSLGTPTSLGVVSTLYYARVAYLARELCAIVGDFEQNKYDALYSKIKKAFITKYIDEEGKIESDTQSAYLMAYRFGIININQTKNNLVRKLKEDDGKLTSGFLGIKHLLPVLCDIGLSNVAYDMITSTEFPGWGYSVINGATTIWEHWDSYTNERGILKGMNSFNHYAFGSCTEWMYEYCLGIRPSISYPGLKRITFAPVFDNSGKITHAKGHYDSDYGRIDVSWKALKNGFEYSVDCPDSISYSFDFGNLQIQTQTKTGTKSVFVLTER